MYANADNIGEDLTFTLESEGHRQVNIIGKTFGCFCLHWSRNDKVEHKEESWSICKNWKNSMIEGQLAFTRQLSTRIQETMKVNSSS